MNIEENFIQQFCKAKVCFEKAGIETETLE
jgi:hypothetical protein